MVKAAKEAGHGDVSERTITDWAQRGLLDHPTRTRRHKGGGRGAFYEWPEGQKDLLLSILEHRSEQKQIAKLCVIPVGIWLYWGDQWVPTHQARSALRTWWAGTGERPSQDTALQNARMICDVFAPKETPRKLRTQLRDVIEESIYSGRFDDAAIRDSVDQIFGANGVAGWGPYGHDAEVVADGIRAMSLAIMRYDELTEGYFVEVRARLRITAMSYMRDYPRLAADQTFGNMFEDLNILSFVMRSCNDVLLSLGLRLIAEDKKFAIGQPPLLRWTRPPDEMLRIIDQPQP